MTKGKAHIRISKSAVIGSKVADFERLKDRMSEADWVRKMKDYFAKTGTFRAEDLGRLLGDQTKGVEMGSRESLTRHFCRQ